MYTFMLSLFNNTKRIKKAPTKMYIFMLSHCEEREEKAATKVYTFIPNLFIITERMEKRLIPKWTL